MFYTIYQSTLCPILLVGDDHGLKKLCLDVDSSNGFSIDEAWVKDDEFFKDITIQLEEYFSGSRKNFNVKLNPEGTYFQKKIWHILQKIPYGKVYSYKDVALLAGNADSSRAVGMANSKNPIALLIPCHRVIGSNQQLTGFAFGGVEFKAKLLELEGLEIEERLK